MPRSMAVTKAVKPRLATPTLILSTLLDIDNLDVVKKEWLLHREMLIYWHRKSDGSLSDDNVELLCDASSIASDGPSVPHFLTLNVFPSRKMVAKTQR